MDGVTGYYGNNKNITEREIVLETQIGNRKKWFDWFWWFFFVLVWFFVIQVLKDFSSNYSFPKMNLFSES